MGYTLGSLFSGYGGLDMAVYTVFGNVETRWVSDIDNGSCKVLAHRFPDIPNLGDVTTVNWAGVEPVDIIAGGSPCQDLSTAGRRAGMRPGTRSGLWESMREAIYTLNPTFVVWENVEGALSATATTDSQLESDKGPLGDRATGFTNRALGRLLGDLTDLGYDTQWETLRASTIGAPHHRNRVFLLAYRQDLEPALHTQPHIRRSTTELRSPVLPTPDTRGDNRKSDGYDNNGNNFHSIIKNNTWGKYAPAIQRWETSLGRPAPTPTEPGKTGHPQLSAKFTEWMMGLPDGWITDTPGMTRTEAIRMCGNGVVPQQAATALSHLATLIKETAA